MTSKLLLAALSFGGLAMAAGAAARAKGVKPGGPDQLSDTRSLGRVIAEADNNPVHVIFVHGIRATGPGASDPFRAGLRRYVKDACPSGVDPPRERSHRFDMGPVPNETFLPDTVWTPEDWAGSRPFVDRYVYRRPDAPPIVVDEVNWWPMVFALKCNVILRPDANLSGVDKADLEVCARDDPPYHPFIDPETLKRLLASRPASGGGALVNAALKQQLVDWGLTDVAIATGPMSIYLHRAMEAAFTHAADFEGRGSAGQEFVVVCESLGGFVVLDAFASAETENVRLRDVMSSTADLYFFANQFAFLELTRSGGPSAVVKTLEGPGSPASVDGERGRPRGLLSGWASQAPTGRSHVIPPRPKQIIAFNDPSDVLTFLVPAIPADENSSGATVVNLYTRNGWDVLGLVANPVTAHTGYSTNPAVLKTMFTP